MLKNILLSFIPLFVAVDAVGVLPIFVSLTEGIQQKEKTKIIVQSVLTALCLAVGFIFLGKGVFKSSGNHDRRFYDCRRGNTFLPGYNRHH